MNDFDITDIEKLFANAVRNLGVSSHVWNNRPKSTDDSISEFAVVRVSGSVTDLAAFGSCRVVVYLYARDIKEMKNAKKLSVMQKTLQSLPLWIDPLLIDGHPRIIGDTPDDFGFHARIISFKVYIKVE